MKPRRMTVNPPTVAPAFAVFDAAANAQSVIALREQVAVLAAMVAELQKR